MCTFVQGFIDDRATDVSLIRPLRSVYIYLLFVLPYLVIEGNDISLTESFQPMRLLCMQHSMDFTQSPFPISQLWYISARFAIMTIYMYMYNVFKDSEHSSIERLTESFVAGLQVDFPSTVSTVFRSARMCRCLRYFLQSSGCS